MRHKWRHWLTWRQGPQPLRAREPTVFTVTWETCRCKCRTCVALPKVQRGVQTWRPLPTWRQGARWRGRTWRQNVASRGVRKPWPDVASKCGVTGPGSQMASQDVASKCGVTCLRGVREPGSVPGRGVKMWRHLPTWRQGATCGRRSSARRRRTWRQNVASLAGATWRRWTWRQNVASGAIDLRGVTGRGVKTWRHEARPPGTCLQNVSLVVGRYVHPHRRPPCVYIYIYIHIFVCVCIYTTHTHIYMSIYLRVHMCLCMYCVYVHIACVYACVYIYAYMMQVCPYVCM